MSYELLKFNVLSEKWLFHKYFLLGVVARGKTSLRLRRRVAVAGGRKSDNEIFGLLLISAIGLIFNCLIPGQFIKRQILRYSSCEKTGRVKFSGLRKDRMLQHPSEIFLFSGSCGTLVK